MGSLSIPVVLPAIESPELEVRKYANLLLALMERRERCVALEARPFELTIDPTTLCQLSCPYCSTGAGTMQRSKGVLDVPTHARMLDELGDALFLVWYFSTGEPLLNKRLAEIVAATRGREIFSVVSTNLSLPLSDARIDELLGCGLGCISVSLDGATPESYARYRVGGDFELVTRNLRRLVERKRALALERPLIEWRFLVFRHNQHEIARARALAADWGVDLLEFFRGYAPPGAAEHEVRLADPVDLAPELSGPAVERAAQRRRTTLLRFVDPADCYPPPPPRPDHGYGTKCDWLYFGSTLFPNGSVSPCCLSNEEPDDFGRLSDGAGFADVWNNDRYREARALWHDGRWSETQLVCARCPNRDAQDYQFRTTIQALLRNAPDWVLKVLARDPERFFFDVDFRLSPRELDPLRDGRVRVDATFPGVARLLTGCSGGRAASAQRMEFVRGVIA
jgi:MoaA/NifB/PqqE/SkfB family radical SAM enzyme